MHCQRLASLGIAAILLLAVPTKGLAQSLPEQVKFAPQTDTDQLRWRLQEPSLPASNADLRSRALHWEIGYLALSGIDAAETITCLSKHTCHEGNPLLGKHPSAGKLVAIKLGAGLVHFLAFSRANQQNPRAALRIAQISCALQGGVVLLNARLAFK